MGEISYGKCRYLSVNWEFSKIKTIGKSRSAPLFSPPAYNRLKTKIAALKISIWKINRLAGSQKNRKIKKQDTEK
jgi:hypothetical protein